MGRRPSCVSGLFVMVLMLSTPMALGISQAENSGGVVASSSTVGLVPSDPVMGGSVEIRLLLENTNSVTATDVEYRFYKDGIQSSSKFVENTVTIAAGESEEVSATWSALTEGEHKVWIEFEYGGDAVQSFYRSFTVSGLANLELSHTSLSPSSGIREGDTVQVAIEVSNTGTVEAADSEVFLGIEGMPTQDQYLSTGTLVAGGSVWLNTTLDAPVGGEHEVVIMPDVNGVIEEVVESGKDARLTLSVDPEPDFLHEGELSISTPADSIRGDWEVSGTLMRKHATGDSTVSLGFTFPEHVGTPVVIPPLEVQVSGVDDEVTQEWSTTLTWDMIQSLGEGQHLLQVQLDPFQTLDQATTSNDIKSVLLDVRPAPNVVLDEFANPSTTTVDAGDPVTWRVLVSNTGDIAVSGMLRIEWEGQTTDQPVPPLDAGASYTWSGTLVTSAHAAHKANFSATWIAADGSYDSDPDDSVARGSVQATTTLQLGFATTTAALVDSSGLAASSPIEETSHVYSIQLTSSGLGSATILCEETMDGQVSILANKSVNIQTRGEKVDFECPFDASGRTTVHLTIRSLEEGTITRAHQKSFNVDVGQGLGDENEGNLMGTALLLTFSALILIGILVAAVMLTRRRIEDVERDIYEYCPACDGELEGDEDKCPHCDFNLKRARRRFHDCPSCDENIPSLLENCPYCGAVQDLRSQFKQRQKKEVPLIEEPEEVEEEPDDEEEIVTGTESFGEMAGEFGYDEDNLESHWDERLEEAEAEIDQMLERQAELEATEEAEDAETDDEEGPVAAIPNIARPEEAMSGLNLDEVLGDKDSRRHITDEGDDGEDLDASDASIRADLFNITGEEGVLPGQEVIVGMGVQDHRLAGNELPEEAMDFSFEDDELTPAIEKKKRQVRRRKEASNEAESVGECGACGAEIAVDAEECGTCGARFA